MMLTSRQSRMAGDTNPSFLPVHVNELALQAAACCTKNLKKKTKKNQNKTQPQMTKERLFLPIYHQSFYSNREDVKN